MKPNETNPAALPVPGDGDLIARHYREIVAKSRQVWSGYRLGMDPDDVANEIAMAVLQAIRKHFRDTGELPSQAFVRSVITKRRLTIIRNAQAAYRKDQARDTTVRNADGEECPADVVDEAPSVEERLEREMSDDVALGLVYMVRRNLSPAGFALLYLHDVEEREPREIAKLIGDDGPVAAQKVSRQIGVAKGVAIQFLRQLGITRMAQVNAVALEDFHGKEFDGEADDDAVLSC